MPSHDNKISKPEAKKRFEAVLEEDGVKFTSRGLPDYVTFKPDGALLGVYYVTTGKRRSLRKRQWLVARALVAAGIHCCGWTPQQDFFEIKVQPRRSEAGTPRPEVVP